MQNSTSSKSNYSTAKQPFKVPSSSSRPPPKSRPSPTPSKEDHVTSPMTNGSSSQHFSSVRKQQTFNNNNRLPDQRKPPSPKRNRAPPPPPSRTTPQKKNGRVVVEDDSFDKEDYNDIGESSENDNENFSIKEMVKMRNGVSKQAVLKARERNERVKLNQHNMDNEDKKSKSQPFNVNRKSRVVENNHKNGRDVPAIEKEHERKNKGRNKRNGELEDEVLQRNTSFSSSSQDNSPNSSREVVEEEEINEMEEEASFSVSSAKQLFSNNRSLNNDENQHIVSRPQTLALSTSPGKLPKQTIFHKTSSPSQSSPTTPKTPVHTPGKVSKSIFEQQQQQTNELQSKPLKPVKKNVSKDWETVQSSVNKSTSSPVSDKKKINNFVSPSKQHQSPTHSSRSDSSQESRLSYTLDFGESMNRDLASPVNTHRSDTVDGRKSPIYTTVKKEEQKEGELPKENTVSSFRDMFQKKNEGVEKDKTSPSDEFPRSNTVSSARSMFQEGEKNKSPSSSISFKNPPPRLSSVVDELFFHKMSSGPGDQNGITPSYTPQPSRLQSASLFFEPKKEEIKVEKKEGLSKLKDTGEVVGKDDEGKSDEPKRPRTPQDIWNASQEAYDNKDVEDNDQSGGDGAELSARSDGDDKRFDDVTSRTHVLLMKQAQGTGDEMPAQIQMAQILGDKDQVGYTFEFDKYFTV